MSYYYFKYYSIIKMNKIQVMFNIFNLQQKELTNFFIVLGEQDVREAETSTLESDKRTDTTRFQGNCLQMIKFINT